MKPTSIAFYLPQFHPTDENNEWWGAGFTEWTNVAKARPLFLGHEQPNLPGELGFYDLRLSETREEQAALAKSYGIDGFCYWHYWFDGRRILNRPFDEVLNSRKPDFPFCLGWANHSWSRIWQGKDQEILIDQTYPGRSDHINHFNFLLKAFKDERYIKIDNKPLLVIFDPLGIPDSREMSNLWQEMALSNNLNGVYLVGIIEDIIDLEKFEWNHKDHGFDAITVSNQTAIAWAAGRNKTMRYRINDIVNRIPLINERPLHVYEYEEALKYFIPKSFDKYNTHPCVVPNWDNTPRHGIRGVVLKNATPELFRINIRESIKEIKNKKPSERLLFIKSWNEWAEGNHLEPNQKNGRRYLEVFKEEIEAFD